MNAVTNAVQIDQKSYEMPLREGISIAQFLTVADIERSARCAVRTVMSRIPPTDRSENLLNPSKD